MDNNTAERIRIQDYRTTFGTPSGKRVLEDLVQKFMYQDARAHVQAGNAIGVAWIDAQRQLMVSVLKWATTPVVEQTQFVQPIPQGDPYSD